MNIHFSGKSMASVYGSLVNQLAHRPDNVSTTRKGEKLYELAYAALTIFNPYLCLAESRPGFSTEYLEKEFDFYCSGSNKLEDAVKLSKFWNKCSDDGKTVTSNYGKLLFHDHNAHGQTQFDHALEALKNNKDSKKAVMTIYDKEHAFISNDNPCTMFLHARIKGDCLFLRTHMRSNDVWFGIVYDVPFFCAIQYALVQELKETYPNLQMGNYTHYACSLHMYERNEEDLMGMLSNTIIDARLRLPSPEVYALGLFNKVHEAIVAQRRVLRPMSMGMEAAWRAAEQSPCLKKKCGAALVDEGAGRPKVIAVGWGGREDLTCKTCARDEGEKFHGDGCWSVHAEMRAIMYAIKNHAFDKPFAGPFTMYVTHGPCDACMKLMDYMYIRKVVYDVPYKTDFGHWPRITVEREDATKVDHGDKPREHGLPLIPRYWRKSV